MEILSHIELVGIAGVGLRLSATDLRVHATAECRADIEAPAACAIPADKLHGIVNSIDAELITMSLGANMAMEITGDSRKYSVSCLSAEEFPAFPSIPSGSTYIDPGVLPDLVTAVQHASSRDESKSHLCGVHLISEGGKLTSVATDGHRMALAAKELFNFDNRINPGITILTPACKLISAITGDIEYRMAEDGNNIHLSGGGLGLALRLPEGKYPAFRRILQEDLKHAFTVSASDFAAAIEACGVMIEGEYKGVQLVMSEDTLTVSALSRVGVALATIPAMGDPGLDIMVNSKFLLQSVKSMRGELFVKYNNAYSPLMLIPVDHGPWDERIEILMPLRDGLSAGTGSQDTQASHQAPPIDYVGQGFTRDEAKLLLAGFSLARYDRTEKAVYTAHPVNGRAAWSHHVRSPFGTYSLAERELKETVSQPGFIEVTMTGSVRPGHKQKELFAAGFDMYRAQGLIPGHGTPRIKCASQNWGTWCKYDSPGEVQAAWDELMQNEKALEG